MSEKMVPFFKKEVEKFQYFQMPKWLFNEPYCDLSLMAKMTYTLLFNRLSLSLKNEWQDEKGQVFVYYANEKLADKKEGLNCSVPTVIKAKKELQEVGLLREVRQGLTLSNRIYLLGPSSFSQEVKDFNHRSKNSFILDDKNLETNKTEKSKTEKSNYYHHDDEAVLAAIVPAFQKAFRGHTPTPFQMEDLQKYHVEDGVAVEVLVEAIKRTSNAKADYRYLQKILSNWARKGIQSMEQVEAADRAFEERKGLRYGQGKPAPATSNVPDWAEEPLAEKSEMSAESREKMAQLKREMLALEEKDE